MTEKADALHYVYASTDTCVYSYGEHSFFTYFYYFYKTLSFIHSGTTVSGIRREKLISTLFPLPPFPEQIRIVEKVDRLLVYCDELEKQVKENQVNSEKLMGVVLGESFA